MKTAQNPFSRRTIFILVAVALVSLLLGFGLAIFGDELGRPPTADANTFSRSALGHNALLRLLRKLEVPVVVSQYDSDVKAKDSLLLLMEPHIHSENLEEVQRIIGQADGVLLVLPKWTGEVDDEDPTVIKAAHLLPDHEVLEVLALVDSEATLTRPQATPKFAAEGGVDVQPSLQKVQLIESQWIEPVVASDDGILFGKLAGEDIWILSDPDLVANHGLDDGDNAHLAVQLFERARDQRSLVFDETLHGFLRQPSLYRQLFEFPLVLVTIQVLLTAILLIWSATGRFGKPVARPPAIAPGKEFLIDNTAALLRFGGHTAHGLVRYRDVAVESVARKLHAPQGIAHSELVAWLDRIGRARRVSISLDAIAAEVAEVTAHKRPDGRAVTAAAHRIHTWEQEMIHGSSANK